MASIFISHSSRDNEHAAKLLTWLEKEGYDRAFLDFDDSTGISPGADWEKTLYTELERSEAVLLILTPNWLESKWCFAEFVQARALGKAIFPVILSPVGDHIIAGDIQQLDLTKDTEGGLTRLSKALSEIVRDAQGGFAWNSSRAPYPGLMAYQEEDAAIFFGRDPEIRKLIELLNAGRIHGSDKLLAVLGSSGSGKSSLLRAGALPRLRRDNKNWIIVPPFRPQVHPMAEFSQAVSVALSDPDAYRTYADLKEQDDFENLTNDMSRRLRAKFGANEAQILISIDQGEELFSMSSETELQTFLRLLKQFLSSGSPVSCVMTLRSDFLPRLQKIPFLKNQFDSYLLSPIPLDRVPSIIRGPAKIAGITVEDELVYQATSDAETEDALPLLAFALRELYDRHGSNSHQMRAADYRALGNPQEGTSALENAVRIAADDLISRQNPSTDELMALRKAFVPGMVQVSETGEISRRCTSWQKIPIEAHQLISKFVDARLLVSRGDLVSRDADSSVAVEHRHLEVTHESLLRKWPLLRGWIEEDRDFLVWATTLTRDERKWREAPRKARSEQLLTGWELASGLERLKLFGERLEPRLRAFITRSYETNFYGRTLVGLFVVFVLSTLAAGFLEGHIASHLQRRDWSNTIIGASALVTHLNLLYIFDIFSQLFLWTLLVFAAVKYWSKSRGSS